MRIAGDLNGPQVRAHRGSGGASLAEGNTVAVTLEAIINDDLYTLAKLPTKLATAATVTINEYVANVFMSDPTMADGISAYDTLNHGGNASTTALSPAALQAGIAAMMKQTNSAGKRIGARPRFLIVPPDLLWTTLAIVQSDLMAGTNNNDRNTLKGACEVVTAISFTDATDWYLQADPSQVEGVEVGFLNGQREPELLVQSDPLLGTAFTNDAITYKVRWIFGAGWVDWRGTYRSVVTG